MSLDLATAEKIVKAGIARAEEMGIKVSIAVLDDAGNLVHLSRMDGTNFLAPVIAQGKAFTAAAWRQPSGDVEKRGLQRPAFWSSVATASQGRAVIGKGALPIVIDGKTVGATGASGGTSDEDEEVVRVGIAAIGG